jgi:hypothetical protein
MNIYLWREHASLMRASLTILGLLVLYSGSVLLGHFGVISGKTAEGASIAFGVAFLFASVWEIVVAVGAVRKEIRLRRAAQFQG